MTLPKVDSNGFPRRQNLETLTPAELAIRLAILAVESVGAHVLLTDAVVLLTQAKDAVADYLELPE